MSLYDPDNITNKFPDNIFESLMGGTYDFYGVDDKSFCIGVGGARLVLEAVEDPSDGYRSYFGCFRTSDIGAIFFGRPIARVILEVGGRSERCRCFCGDNDPYDSSKPDNPCPDHLQQQQQNFSGWVLRDADNGHLWLQVGTDHGEDYYPCFTFRYQPDPTKKIESNV